MTAKPDITGADRAITRGTSSETPDAIHALEKIDHTITAAQLTRRSRFVATSLASPG